MILRGGGDDLMINRGESRIFETIRACFEAQVLNYISLSLVLFVVFLWPPAISCMCPLF